MQIYHHNDADGRSAAAIVRKAHDNINMEFHSIDYKDDFPHEKIKDGEIVIIVDFSLEPEDMKKLRAKTDKIYWIDHHATAEKYEKEYGQPKLKGLRNFKEKEKAGCELTWDFYFEGQDMPIAVAYIGDYDKWAHKLPQSLNFFEGLKMEKHEPTDPLWKKLLYSHKDQGKEVDRILENGKTAIKYRDEYCREMREGFGYETELHGLKCYALNVYRFGSKAFEGVIDDYDACIAYISDGDQYTVSMYTEKDNVDVGKVCEKLGKKYNTSGGGHRGAAGFVCKDLPFKPKGEKSATIDISKLTPEQLAKKFHTTYERLASNHGYKTRKDSAVDWADVPENNKSLMIAVAAELLGK